jgi:hypothetical protein
MAGKGSSKQSRSIGGDAQKPSASKKKNSPGTDAVDNDAAPSNATAGVAVNPTINDDAINGKSTIDDAAPSNATGGNTANPTINNNIGRGATSSNGPQMLFAMPQTPSQVLMATTKKQAMPPSTWPLCPLQPSPPPTH